MDRIFRALADRNRLRIVMILKRGPLTVNEISSVLGLTQPNASRHLKALHEAGVLVRRGEAGRAWYSITGGDALVDALSRLLEEHRGRMSGFSRDMTALSRCYDHRKMLARSFFSRVAEEWGEVAAGLPDPGSYMDGLTAMLGGGGTALELGCGTGAMIRMLAERFRDVIAVDSSPEMLDVATRAVGDSGADFRLGALEHLPVADSSVDAALAHMVLHHLADPGEVFPEVDRVLVPGGRLLVADLSHHADEPFRMSQGDLWPGFEPAEIETWAGRSRLKSAGCMRDASDRVLLMLFTKENER